MPYVDGESLRDRLRRQGRLDVAEGLRLGRQVGLALDYAHRRGVVHRDVKPENILLGDEQALLTDFGIAQSAQRGTDPKLTAGGLALGTPMYMSPEQAVGDRELDGRSDIYSLAAVLFEALTGTPPFSGATAQAVIGKRFVGPVPSARASCGTVPALLDLALQRALAPDPAGRFATAAAFVTALVASHGPSGSLAVTQATAGRSTVETARSVRPIRSIAVLPFANMSMDSANEYFSDGITEELIDALAHVPDLKVAGRGSSFAFKSSSVDLRSIGEQLGVQAIVEGSVRRAGDRVRITAHLVSAKDGHTMWSEHYEREVKDIFELQETIAGAIVAALRLRLNGSSILQRPQRATADPEAYELLLKGTHFLQLGPEGLERAVSYFERAVARDPDFARAHAGLAGAYVTCGLYSLMRPRDAFPRARRSAVRALELDETLARAHSTLGGISHLYDWDWEAARQHFRRAAELRGIDLAGWGPSFLLVSTGRFDEALAQSHRIIERDPLALHSHVRHAFALLLARRVAEVLQHCKLILELNPNSSEAYRLMGHAHEALGQLDESRDAFERAVVLSHRHPWALSGLARTLARLGRHDEANAHVAALLPGVGSWCVPPTALAHIHAVANHEAAFEWLERGIEERDVMSVYLRVNPLFDSIRDDPRFERLIQRIGMPLLDSA